MRRGPKVNPASVWQRALANGIRPETAYARIRYKAMTADDAVSVPLIRDRNRLYSCNGKSLTLNQWSVELGIDERTLRHRMYRGWSIHRTFSEPLIVAFAHRRRA